jgi:hypothetical protein
MASSLLPFILGHFIFQRIAKAHCLSMIHSWNIPNHYPPPRTRKNLQNESRFPSLNYMFLINHYIKELVSKRLRNWSLIATQLSIKKMWLIPSKALIMRRAGNFTGLTLA